MGCASSKTAARQVQLLREENATLQAANLALRAELDSVRSLASLAARKQVPAEAEKPFDGGVKVGDHVGSERTPE